MGYIEENIKNVKNLLENINKKRYQQLIVNRYQLILDMIKDYTDPEKPVLDIGTRDGALLDYLRDNKFTQTYGVDIYEGSVELARKRGHLCWVADVQDLNLDKKFGTIIMSHVLEHCPDVQKVLQNVYNHLEDDGILFVEVPRQNKQKVPSKDGHYHFFPSLQDLVETFNPKEWKLLKKFKSSQNTRLKVVMRKRQ